MSPPQFLLDALNDSISSGTFVDTKFYAFTRRDASGRVCSPRALYCNSRILDTVPYFSSLFSDGFSEGKMKDINDGFPPDSHSYTEDYDYMSDSDLEDEPFSEEGEAEPNEGGSGPTQGPENAKDTKSPQTDVSNSPPSCPSSVEAIGAQDDKSAKGNPSRMGKVAIIRDMGAVTFEAVLYFLYTGKINFAPLSSDPRYELPARARAGDWSAGRLPSPSAKSIYRLADKYDMPTLKEQAKAYISNNLEFCDILEEIFSNFSYLFPEMLSIQVSILVNKMNEESKQCAEGATRKRLQEKIASLSQPQARRAADALSMIWSYVNGPLKPPVAQPEPTFSMAFTFFLNWHRVELALLKSIATGVFIDVQLCAFSKICNNLPFDPKPLFVSSIVIEEWGPAVTTQTIGIGSRGACLVDGPRDDYASWDGEFFAAVLRDEDALTHLTEAIDGESREVVLLMSGAWKTWKSLFSYAYTNKMTFSNLDASTSKSHSAEQGHEPQSCSPRSMYTLAKTLGIEDAKMAAFNDIQSKLSSSNITKELFSSFTASHGEVMDMEIGVLDQSFINKDPKLLIDHIQSVASGEASFFPTTLSLVYDRRIGKVFPKEDSPSTSLPEKSPGGQNVNTPNPFQFSSPASAVASSSTPGAGSSTTPTIVTPAPPPTREPAPPSTPTTWKLLKCARCGGNPKLRDLYDGLLCPWCPEKGKNGYGVKGRPYMRCSGCSQLRPKRVDTCTTSKCGARFL